MAKLKGIDVSVWNGNVDWNKVKGKVDFAILRVGYGSNIVKQDDKTFKRNADECTRLGIPFGVYLYSYANNIVKAKSEAEHVLRLIKGYKLDLPVYYDLEDEGTTGKCSNSMILEMFKAFAGIIEGAGYEVGVYANKYWWTTKLTDTYYNRYSKWVAQYAQKCSYTGSYDIWQHTSKGTIEGVKGNIDMNICYKDLTKPLAVGDKVKIVGCYASSAYDKSARNKVAKGRIVHIVNVYDDGKYPYQLGEKKDDASSENTIGFANAAAVKKL